MEARLIAFIPVGDDGRLYGGRETAADGKHVGGELDYEVLETQRSVHDDSVQERDHFWRAAARRRRMNKLQEERRRIYLSCNKTTAITTRRDIDRLPGKVGPINP